MTNTLGTPHVERMNTVAPLVRQNRVEASGSRAIVETTAGKVRGYTCDGTYTFKR